MGSGGETGVEGVHIVKKTLANGSHRWYIFAFRGDKPAIRTVDGGPKPKLTQADIKAIGEKLTSTGSVAKDTLQALIAVYRSPKNPDWQTLAESTKGLWGDCLDAILTKWGKTPLRFWSDPRMVTKVMAWRDSMASTPRAADEHVANLRRLLEYGRLRGKVTINVAAGIPTLYKGGQREAIIWTKDDIDLFRTEANQSVMDALLLCSFTGLRRQDLVGLTLPEVGELAIRRTALKKSRGKRRRVILPIIPGLKEFLAELATRHREPGVETVLVTEGGAAWTAGGLGSSIQEVHNRLFKKHKKKIVHITEDGTERRKHLHDMRGTFATKIMTVPGEKFTDREIADLLGWEEEQVAEIRRVYVDDAAIVVSMTKRMQNMHKDD